MDHTDCNGIREGSHTEFVEPLLEELIELQSSSPSFRQLFRSRQTTSLLINAYADFVNDGAALQHSKRDYVRILEKMNHFLLSFTLDATLASSQKQQGSRLSRFFGCPFNSSSLFRYWICSNDLSLS